MFISFRGARAENEIFVSDIAQAADIFSSMMRKSFDIHCAVVEKKSTYRVLSSQGKEKLNALCESFDKGEDKLELDCCVSAFIRGVFLACGTLTDPSKGYHFELSPAHPEISSKIYALLMGAGFSPKFSKRNSDGTVYFKDSSEIEDVLTFIGAQTATLEMIEAKIFKDMRNNINRVTNFETANYIRTYDAATVQCQAIDKLERAGVLGQLNKELIETAAARVNNPEASLNELCAILGGVSRSGLNHRLQKLIQLSQSLNKE